MRRHIGAIQRYTVTQHYPVPVTFAIGREDLKRADAFAFMVGVVELARVCRA